MAADLVTAAAVMAIGVILGGSLVALALTFKAGAEQTSKDRASVGVESASTLNEKAVVSNMENSGNLRINESGTSIGKGESAALQVGFSMKEALINAEAHRDEAMLKSPEEVMAELQRGNTRFWMNQATRPEKSAFQRRALINMQFPRTAILSCSDSRVPVEIVFDQGLGDMFVVRNAGNCLDTGSMASLQYAVHHLKVRVLIVMGHEACGAIKASQLPVDQIRKEPQELATALQGLKAGLEGADLSKIRDTKSKDREAMTLNVRRQVANLAKDEGIMGKVRGGELVLTGAFYEISSGIVDFFEEFSRNSLAQKSLQK